MMAAKLLRVLLLACLVWVGLSARSSEVFASHYRIEVLEIFEVVQVEALLAQGITTTEDYLVRTTTREGRESLSQQTGISELEVLVFARLCELLQIEGVGPRAAQLLRASGVVSVADLAARAPAELEVQLAAVNAVEQLTGVNPTVENLVMWIEGAQAVPYHVE